MSELNLRNTSINNNLVRKSYNKGPNLLVNSLYNKYKMILSSFNQTKQAWDKSTKTSQLKKFMIIQKVISKIIWMPTYKVSN